jgi:ABC-2 type transport system ATP-binding protein
MTTSTLSVKTLGKSYNPATPAPDWALRDISLDLPSSTLVALLGANGAGKSTFIHLLCGALIPTEGQVVSLPGAGTIGWCSQRSCIDWYLDVYDNVHMGARLAGIGRREARDRTLQALDVVGLADLGQRRTDQISGGQLQRVQIARALVADPDLLILDEPTVGLDVEAADHVLDELQRRARAGALVIVSSHDLGLLERYCDHVVLLDAGRLVTSEPGDRFMDRFAAEDLVDLTTGQLPSSGNWLTALHDVGIRVVSEDPLRLALPRGTPLGPVLSLLEQYVSVTDVQRTRPGLREAYLGFAASRT